MAETAKEQARSPLQPANLDEHYADRDKRKAERDKRRNALRKCLDAETAAQYESRKVLYEWSVKATYQRPNDKGKLQQHTKELKVVAQNERDAWAMFCDNLGVALSPHEEREIKRLNKRSNFDE